MVSQLAPVSPYQLLALQTTTLLLRVLQPVPVASKLGQLLALETTTLLLRELGLGR